MSYCRLISSPRNGISSTIGRAAAEPGTFARLEFKSDNAPRGGSRSKYTAPDTSFSGIIDISPFTCMNGIVCDTIYPKLSREPGGMQAGIERGLRVYMELARTCQRKKKVKRG